MTRKIYLFFVFLIGLSLNVATAQSDDAAKTSYNNLKFNSQPKHMWELGIHAGQMVLIGDIKPKSFFLPGYGFGIHLRRALDYAWSVRVDAMIGRTCGLEPRSSGGYEAATFNNSVLQEQYSNAVTAANGDNAWYHNYQLKWYSIGFQGVWSLNSFNFNNQIKKWNFYVLAGPGFDFYETYYDAKDANDNFYDFNNIADGLEPGLSADDRKTVKENLNNLLDGTYETRAETSKGRRPGNRDDDDNERQYNIHATVGAGLSRRITPRINISLEHQTSLVFGNEGDLLDGYRWRTKYDMTQFKDLINYTNLRINFNLGSKDKASEPLYWVSPMDLLAEDLAEVKSRPKLDLTDTDGDGVIDMLDQEVDTEAGCAVDTRGVILDSDGDGVVDCKDKETYSPPGYKIDADGVAQVPEPDMLDENDVNRIVDAKIAAIKFPSAPVVTPAEWFLPMIHFDNNKYAIKTTEYGKLHNVAEVMKLNPGLRVAVAGHTDRRAGNCYNDVLSYNRAKQSIDYLVTKYGIPRDRFVLTWGGENTTLIPTDGSSLMNRRVEFKVATSEVGMGMPDCGVNSAGSGGGVNYSGNKEAGY